MEDRLRLEDMLDGLDAVIAFADAQDDQVLAAKCEDVRDMILTRLSTILPS